ncbi:unnamed protein product [Moneuplotes crassus]|uniref:Uncharacterized protein n=1 Tax=Euplotes crassus TaxID=5936 RepID=A0AAD1XL62_EUPCR|nr:unnamed protein product [Moneuplotes crassus]
MKKLCYREWFEKGGFQNICNDIWFWCICGEFGIFGVFNDICCCLREISRVV